MTQIACDVLVIGGGAAGSRAAREAKKAFPELDVAVAVSGVYEAGGSTNMVASEALGINAPYDLMGDGDNADVYYSDMMQTGGGLGDPILCRILADESADRVTELMELGLQFHGENGHPIQQKLSGCTRARSLTCGGSTGREIVRVLKQDMVERGVRIFENVSIYELCLSENGEVCGAHGLSGTEEILFSAKSVVLATGGAASVFKTNVTPPTQSGDGWAMAYDAGCRFVNMEFFQIGPAVTNLKMKFIIHSHMWRLNPRLTNRDNKEFLQDYCDPGVTPREALDLKAMSYPFSVRTAAKYVDIAIFKEIMAGRGTSSGGVYFDVTHVPKEVLEQRAPITYETLLSAGLDLSLKPLELGLAVQNFNGGILIDGNGFTGVKGLYAAGEITGGVHGSDRPGGNNLTDTQVFGYRAGRGAAAYAQNCEHAARPVIANTYSSQLTDKDKETMLRCSELFYRNLTVVRTGDGLQETLRFIEENLHSTSCLQLHNRLLVGKILATVMLARKESRGTHYRDDFRETDPQFGIRFILQKGTDGTLKLSNQWGFSMSQNL